MPSKFLKRFSKKFLTCFHPPTENRPHQQLSNQTIYESFKKHPSSNRSQKSNRDVFHNHNNELHTQQSIKEQHQKYQQVQNYNDNIQNHQRNSQASTNSAAYHYHQSSPAQHPKQINSNNISNVNIKSCNSNLINSISSVDAQNRQQQNENQPHTNQNRRGTKEIPVITENISMGPPKVIPNSISSTPKISSSNQMTTNQKTQDKPASSSNMSTSRKYPSTRSLNSNSQSISHERGTLRSENLNMTWTKEQRKWFDIITSADLETIDHYIQSQKQQNLLRDDGINNFEMINKLINSKDRLKGYNILHYAINRGDSQIINYAVNSLKLDINSLTNGTRESALHLAVKSQNLDCIELLTKLGIDKDLRNVNGKRALDYITSYPKMHRVLARARKDEMMCEIRRLLIK